MRAIQAPVHAAHPLGSSGLSGAAGHAISPRAEMPFCAMMLRLASASGNPVRAAEGEKTETAGAQDAAEIRGAEEAPVAAETTGQAKNPAPSGDTREGGGQIIGSGGGTLSASAVEAGAVVQAHQPCDPSLCAVSSSRLLLFPAGFAGAPAKTAVRASAIQASSTPEVSATKPKAADPKPGAAGGVTTPAEGSLLWPGISAMAAAAQPLAEAHRGSAKILQAGAAHAGPMQPTSPEVTPAGGMVPQPNQEVLQPGETVLPARAAAPTDVTTMQHKEPGAQPEAEAISPTGPAARNTQLLEPAISPQTDFAPNQPLNPEVPTDSTWKQPSQPAAAPDAGMTEASRPAVTAVASAMRPSILPAVPKNAPALSAMPELPAMATVRQVAPVPSPESEVMQPTERVRDPGAENITRGQSAAASFPERMGEAKPATPANTGNIPRLTPAESAPMAAVSAIPEELKTTAELHTTELHTTFPAQQASMASAMQAAQGAASRSVITARTPPHGQEQTENPPADPIAAGEILRVTNPAVVSHASVPAASAAPATAAATFEQMDAAAPPQRVASAPHRLAVGIHDSALGWVEIRTHAAEGQVSAVLATESNETRAAAASWLPEVRDYLAGQQIAVGHLSAETWSASSGDREGSADGRRSDSGTATQNGVTAGRPQENFAEESSSDSLSHSISVRV